MTTAREFCSLKYEVQATVRPVGNTVTGLHIDMNLLPVYLASPLKATSDNSRH